MIQGAVRTSVLGYSIVLLGKRSKLPCGTHPSYLKSRCCGHLETSELTRLFWPLAFAIGDALVTS